VEAGKTILLHAALYNWGDTTPEGQGISSEDIGKQTKGERKVQFYKQAIHFFDKAKMWELCITLSNELKVVVPNEVNDLNVRPDETQWWPQFRSTIEWF